MVRDIRCFGSAALQLCWVGAGRSDAHFERDIKLWDYAAGALVAAEAGAVVELPCPENGGLVLAATAGHPDELRRRLVLTSGVAAAASARRQRRSRPSGSTPSARRATPTIGIQAVDIGGDRAPSRLVTASR